jgi:hypothetical protein
VRLRGSKCIAADVGDDAGPVGGHPAELLIIEFDQYSGSQ